MASSASAPVWALLALPPALAFVYLVFRACRRGAASRILCAPTEANAELIAACPAWAAYKPSWFLPGPHLNSIGSAVLRGPPCAPDGSPFRYALRTRVSVSHGGAVHLDWHTTPTRGQPVLLLLHGLTGGSHETYVQWMVAHASEQGGLCCVVMNARGCGASALSSPRCFSAAWTDDVRAATAHVRSLLGPGTPIFHIGYSLGAGILAKFIAEDGPTADSAGAVAVAAAFDLVKSSAALESGLSRVLYNGMLARALQRYYRKHAAVLDAAPWADAASLARIRSARTVRAFDAAAIVPQFGYRDVEHYYADGSAGPLLHRVRVPFLALNAGDDPICALRGLLDQEGTFTSNPHTCAVITPEGGHVAWASGHGFRLGLSWDNGAALQFFQALLARAGYHWHPGTLAVLSVTGGAGDAVEVPLPRPSGGSKGKGRGHTGGQPAFYEARARGSKRGSDGASPDSDASFASTDVVPEPGEGAAPGRDAEPEEGEGGRSMGGITFG